VAKQAPGLLQQIQDYLQAPPGPDTSPDFVIGRITDTNHPCLKAAAATVSKDAADVAPVFGLFTKRPLPRYSLLGEYTGTVLTDHEYEEAKSEQNDRGGDGGDDSSLADTFSTLQYGSTQDWGKNVLVLSTTRGGCNEFSLANDFRSDVSRCVQPLAHRAEGVEAQCLILANKSRSHFCVSSTGVARE
jgi:hypothetical protein